MSFHFNVFPYRYTINLSLCFSFLSIRLQISVLSCTDLASRGLDTCNAHHVINYDFPLNMSDYVHRAGRSGRVGSPQGSRVTSLVGGRIQVHLVQMLERAVRTQTEIPNVNNNIIRIIQRRRSRKASGGEDFDGDEEDEDDDREPSYDPSR